MFLRPFTFAAIPILALAIALGACSDNNDDGLSRDDLEGEYEEVVEGLDRELSELDDAIANADDATRGQLEDRRENVQSARDEAADHLADLRDATDEEFDELRDSLSDGLNDVRDLLDD